MLAGRCEPEGFAQDDLVVEAFKGELHIDQKSNQIILRDKDGIAKISLVPF